MIFLGITWGFSIEKSLWFLNFGWDIGEERDFEFWTSDFQPILGTSCVVVGWGLRDGEKVWKSWIRPRHDLGDAHLSTFIIFHRDYRNDIQMIHVAKTMS